MTATSDAKSLELTVTNFGPIAEAKIELRPMTVFVGPSNTGKSYMAGLVYALHRFFTRFSEETEYGSIRGRPTRAGKSQMNLPQDPFLSDNDIEELHKWLDEVLRQLKTAKRRSDSLIELPESVADFMRPILSRVTRLSGDLDSEIARCFGIAKTSNLVHYPGGVKANVSLLGKTPTETGDKSHFGYHFTVTERGVEIDASIPGVMPLQIDETAANWLVFRHSLTLQPSLNDVAAKERLSNETINFLANETVQHMVDPLSHPAHYLPADRGGVMHAHQVVVRSLIASASRAALRPDFPMPAISGVLGDFLEQLVALASFTQQRDGESDDLAQNLEQTILRGAVHIEQSQIDYPSFVYSPSGWERDLPLMNTSSMVSELAPVVLYLRHVVRPGDLLIIEEPEAHLHPEMQAVFTRQLVAAVQSGIRILITTHSEWILEELANLVRLSELPKDRREGIEDENIALSPDLLGSWFFEPNEETGGSVVREISLDEESATFPAGFGLVTESLYNRWVEISARLQEE